MRSHVLINSIIFILLFLGFLNPDAKAETNRSETRIYLHGNSCDKPQPKKEVAGVALLFLAPLVQPVLEQGFVLVSDLIKKVVDDFSAIYSANKGGHFFIIDGNKISPNFHCIVLVRGQFGKENPPSLVDKYPFATLLSLTDVPEFYFEADMEYSSSAPPLEGYQAQQYGAYLRINPHKLIFNKTKATWGSTKDIVISYELKFNAQPVNGDKESIITMTHIPFLNIEAGSSKEVAIGERFTDYVKLPLPSWARSLDSKVDATKKGLELIKGGLELIKIGEDASSNIDALAKKPLIDAGGTLIKEGQKLVENAVKEEGISDGEAMLFSLKVTVSETEKGKGQELFLKLADAIKDNSRKMSEKAAKQIVPDEK